VFTRGVKDIDEDSLDAEQRWTLHGRKRVRRTAAPLPSR
jgi:hypothetical protein